VVLATNASYELSPSFYILTVSRKVTSGHPVPGGYKYENLALQVGGVSDETLKYGYGFIATPTIQ
jgi:hypothetical protein